MSNIILSSKNHLDAGVTWYGDADAQFPLTNLSNSKFSRIWRYTPASTKADGHYAKILFSLASPVRCGHVALCRHNLSDAAQIRVRAGMARFDIDFTADNIYHPGVVYGGGVNGTRVNEFGVMEAAECPRIEHDLRYHENAVAWSEDLTKAPWGADTGAVVLDHQTVDFGAVGARLIQPYFWSTNGAPYELSFDVRLVSGEGSFTTAIGGSGGGSGDSFTATTEWQRLTTNITTTLLSMPFAYPVFVKTGAAGVLQIRRVQIHRGPSGGQYRKTTDKRRYLKAGLIGEAASTNNLLHSSDLTNAVWTKTGAPTITPNTAVAPDGTTSMDTVLTGAVNAVVQQNITAPGTSIRAASMFFRSSGSTSTSCAIHVTWFSGGALQSVNCFFNPTTGEVISSASNGATLRAAGVRYIGGGFYRAYVEGQGTDAANTLVGTRLDVQGAGVTLISWGYQNEAGSVSSYIPTTTSAASRTVDTAVIEPTAWVPYVWNQSSGAIYHEARLEEINVGQAAVGSYVRAHDVGQANAVESGFRYAGGDLAGAASRIVAGGATNWVYVAPATALGSAVQRQAIRYRVNDFAFAVNGVIVGTDTGPTPSGITAINLLYGANATAYLRRVVIWRSPKTDAELQALTLNGPGAVDYDSGWKNALQMKMRGDIPAMWGHDYDVIKSFSERAIENVSVEIYDPKKVSSSTPFEIGRIFMGKASLQPAVNAEFGLADGWNDRTSFMQSEGGQKFFSELPRIRQVAFAFHVLTHDEAATLHEMQGSGGVTAETLYLPDPEDEAACQRYGFVGRLTALDPLAYPQYATRAMAFQIEKKR